MVFQNIADFYKLIINLRHDFFQLRDRLRGTHTGNHVFALGVHQKLAHQLLLTGSRVAGKRHARAGSIAHITKRHHLYVYSSSPGIRNLILHPVEVGARVVPGTEYRFNGAHQLFFRIAGEISADLGFIFRFKLLGQFLQIFSSQVYVLCDAFFLFHLVDQFFKIFFADFHNHIGIHLNETTIAVPRPSGVAGLSGQHLNNLFVQTEVQNGVHHTGHGSTGAGTH